MDREHLRQSHRRFDRTLLQHPLTRVPGAPRRRVRGCAVCGVVSNQVKWGDVRPKTGPGVMRLNENREWTRCKRVDLPRSRSSGAIGRIEIRLRELYHCICTRRDRIRGALAIAHPAFIPDYHVLIHDEH